MMQPELRTTALFSSRRCLISLAMQIRNKEKKKGPEMWKIRVRILTSVADPSHVMRKLPTQVSNWPRVKSDQSQALKLTLSDSRLWNTVDQGDSEHREK